MIAGIHLHLVQMEGLWEWMPTFPRGSCRPNLGAIVVDDVDVPEGGVENSESEVGTGAGCRNPRLQGESRDALTERKKE